MVSWFLFLVNLYNVQVGHLQELFALKFLLRD